MTFSGFFSPRKYNFMKDKIEKVGERENERETLLCSGQFQENR
jgi:hypothetical protein